MRFPLVLKAMGRLHKSEGGGVVLGLRDADAALAAYADLLARLDPPAVSVESMVDTSRRGRGDRGLRPRPPLRAGA